MKCVWLLFVASFTPWTMVSPQDLRFLGTPIVVNIEEDQVLLKELHRFDCVSPTGGRTAVRLLSVSPQFPCPGCFTIFRESATDSFKLFYLPSQGRTDFTLTPIYNIIATCIDETFNVTSTNVEVRVVTNHLPNFTRPIDTGCSVDGTFTPAGTIIHHVVATDEDNDDLDFTMDVIPAITTANFFIDNDGNIRNRYAMERICVSTIAFNVFVTDFKVTNRVGPALVICTVNNNFEPPTISNLEREISIPENTTFPSTLVTFLTPPANPPIIYYDISTQPASALTLFRIVNNELRLVKEPSFEDPNHQNINVSIIPHNEYCASAGHFLIVKVTDVNDIPKLVPDITFLAVNEGTINTDFNTILIDDDFGDTFTYDIIAGDPNNLFDIALGSRRIISVGTYDVDQGVDPENVTLLIEVTDSQGATANATVRMRIDDINDNAPIITQTTYTFTATGCSYLNSLMGTITATDDDSSRNGNNRITFTPASSGPLSVSSDGNIYVSGLMPESQTFNVEVYARDQGTDPGPLQSTLPAAVSLTTSACPTTNVATTVQVNTVTVATTTTTTSATSGPTTTTGSGTLDPGTIAAIVVGILAVPLLIVGGLFLMSICCPAAFASLRNSCCGRGSASKDPKPKPRPTKAKERDYWRPPSDSRSQRRVSPDNPNRYDKKDDNPFDFWAQGNTPRNNGVRPKPAADIGQAGYF